MSALFTVATVTIPKITYLAILPELILLGGAVVLLGVSSVMPQPLRAPTTTALTLLVGLASLSASLVQWYDVAHHGPHVTIAAAVVQDGFSALVAVAVSCAVFLSALVADGWMRREHTVGPEFDVLMLVSASGAMVMGAANDLIVVFLGLEILSISLYVLAAMNARRAESGEAALKYFVLGSFSSAVFVYGVALVYGATGSTNLDQIADFLARNVMLHNSLLLAGLALLLVGFGFKVAAVPFHLWTPDVYQGAPTPVTGFMAAVAKIGGFAALLRVFLSSFGLLRDDWQPAVWVLAALTLLFGAVVALAQRDIKRMLAYSSINHAGFVLLGLQAATVRGPENGVQGSLYYLFVYVFMVIGSFAVVTVVGGSGDTRHDLDRYRGLARARPWLAGSLAVLLMAQAGIPFTTGFWAKLEVISASVGAGSTALAVISMVSAAIAAFFYLRVILLAYAPAGPGALRAEDASDATAPSDGETGGDGYAYSPGSGQRWARPPAAATTMTRAVGTETESTALERGTGVVRPGLDDETVLDGVDDETVPTEVDDETVPTEVDDERGLGVADDESEAVSPTVATAIGLCVGVTVLFGVWPAPLLDFAHQATLLLH